MIFTKSIENVVCKMAAILCGPHCAKYKVNTGDVGPEMRPEPEGGDRNGVFSPWSAAGISEITACYVHRLRSASI